MDSAKCFLIIYNVSKKHNVGSIIRSASAMNVNEVWVLGKKKISAFGNQGTAKRVVYRFFDNVTQLKSHAVESKVQILGIEIIDSAKSIWTFPFSGSTAFVMGNEGTGLTDLEKEICDGFVYIPQYQSNTESLNVSVAAGIVLNHFARNYYADWAGYQESERQGEKFIVQDRTGIQASMTRAEEIREERRKKREEGQKSEN